ncbi:hypothetical protein ES703_95420 [subsurface metagenome]
MPTKCYPFITVLYFFRYFFAFLYLPLFLFPSAKSYRKTCLARQTRISLLPCRNFLDRSHQPIRLIAHTLRIPSDQTADAIRLSGTMRRVILWLIRKSKYLTFCLNRFMFPTVDECSYWPCVDMERIRNEETRRMSGSFIVQQHYNIVSGAERV